MNKAVKHNLNLSFARASNLGKYLQFKTTRPILIQEKHLTCNRLNLSETAYQGQKVE